MLWPSISHSSSSWVSTDAAASQTHWSLLPTNSRADPKVLVIKVQVTASMLPSPVPVLSSSTQSVLHWVGAKVGLTVGAMVGRRVGLKVVLTAGLIVGDLVGKRVGLDVGEAVGPIVG